MLAAVVQLFRDTPSLLEPHFASFAESAIRDVLHVRNPELARFWRLKAIAFIEREQHESGHGTPLNDEHLGDLQSANTVHSQRQGIEQGEIDQSVSSVAFQERNEVLSRGHISSYEEGKAIISDPFVVQGSDQDSQFSSMTIGSIASWGNGLPQSASEANAGLIQQTKTDGNNDLWHDDSLYVSQTKDGMSHERNEDHLALDNQTHQWLNGRTECTSVNVSILDNNEGGIRAVLSETQSDDQPHLEQKIVVRQEERQTLSEQNVDLEEQDTPSWKSSQTVLEQVQQLRKEGRRAISVDEAARLTGYKPDYLRRLSRSGKIDASQQLADGLLLSSLERYLKRARFPVA